MTDATTSQFRMPSGRRVFCSTETIVIEEGSPGLSRFVTGIVVLLGTAACAVMCSLPLAGLLAGTESAWTDWLIAVSFLCMLLLVGSLVVPLTARLIIPWRLSLALGAEEAISFQP